MTSTKLNDAITSAEEAGTTWWWECQAEWWLSLLGVHQSCTHAPAVQSGCTEPCAGTIHCPICKFPEGDSKKPPAQTAVRSEACQPPSGVWIKVGLLPSCLHNNTLDRASAAVGACGSDYLAGRRSLSLSLFFWLANGPGAVPVQVSLNKSAELKLGRIPGETLMKPLDAPLRLVLPHFLSVTVQLWRVAFCIFSAWRSLSWVTARASELDWFELSLHVFRRPPAAHRLSQQESGPKEAESGVSSVKKEWQDQRHGDSMGSHTLSHIIFEMGITNCD